MVLSDGQLRAARGFVGWSQHELAEQSKRAHVCLIPEHWKPFDGHWKAPELNSLLIVMGGWALG